MSISKLLIPLLLLRKRSRRLRKWTRKHRLNPRGKRGKANSREKKHELTIPLKSKKRKKPSQYRVVFQSKRPNQKKKSLERPREKKLGNKKVWVGFWDEFVIYIFIYLIKKSHKIHSTKPSIEIRKFLNIKRLLVIYKKFWLNIIGFKIFRKKNPNILN